VVAYRSEELVEACLRSIPAEVEQVLLWDNDPAHRSADVAEALNQPRTRVVRSAANTGFAAAVNRAAALLRGSDLLLINPDSRLEQGAVSALVGALDRSPEVAVAGSRLRGENDEPAPDSWRFPTPGRAILGAFAGLGAAYRPARSLLAPGVEDIGEGFVPFTAVLLRRSVFDQLGGFDEAFWLYGEDTDYCYRARQAGHRIVVATAAMATHVGGASSTSETRAVNQLRGGDLFRTKHFRPGWSQATALALRAGAAWRLAVADLAARVWGSKPGRFQEWRRVQGYYRDGGLDASTPTPPP
jgi:GT2 family glycosyltransferase